MEYRRFPNLFWPITLIGLGVVFLLTNLDIIDPVRVDVLWRMWPVFLVLVGVNLLFGRRSWVSSVLSALLALAVVAFLIFAPQVLDVLPEADMVTESFSEEVDGASSATVTLDFDRGDLKVELLEGSSNLFEAEVTHNEEVDFRTSGSSNRTVRMELENLGAPDFGFMLPDQRITADVGLAGDVPLDLQVEIGSGSADLFLTGLELTSLEAASGSGGIEAFLPAGDFPVKLSAGSGSLDVETAANSELDLNANVGSGRITLTLAEGSSGRVELDSGSGGIRVYIPEGMAVRVDASTGSGSVNVPGGFVRVSGGDNLVGDSGTWESPDFDDADEQVFIDVEVGSGSVRVIYQ